MAEIVNLYYGADVVSAWNTEQLSTGKTGVSGYTDKRCVSQWTNLCAMKYKAAEKSSNK